jgi:hypothetical protein
MEFTPAHGVMKDYLIKFCHMKIADHMTSSKCERMYLRNDKFLLTRHYVRTRASGCYEVIKIFNP